MSALIGSIDQGTSSSRFTVYSESGETIASHQAPVSHTTPHPGWIEQNPIEIINSIKDCLQAVAFKLEALDRSAREIVAIGITNQRETLIIWDKETGKPLYNAIVWCDNRNASIIIDLKKNYGDQFFHKTGLPFSTYFTATKILWLRQNEPSIRKALDNGKCLIGTIDTWIVWCLTGHKSFVTDVTNASRTFLFDLNTLQWDQELCQVFGVPRNCLAEIRSSAEIYGYISDEFAPYDGIPISGVLGDQQASLVGNKCNHKGTAKITYGTGCFLLYNIGNKPLFSEKGLITTIAFQMGPKSKPCYAIEGSIATCGMAVRWLNGILGVDEPIYDLAKTVKNSGGVYFVPAFSGLFCPYWRPDARGCLLGITGFTTRGHIARAVLEGIALQAMDVLKCVDIPLSRVRVDGGLSRSDLLIQFQADLLEIEVARAANVEATSKGAAIAAAYGVGMSDAGIVKSDEDVVVFKPKMSKNELEKKRKMWKKAVERSMEWIEPDEIGDSGESSEYEF
ncbi:glycerol kinase [Histomonas meleagridis]|uniref:glycerol kinase n=1 Tax=Histomonas meleagridis TaxID=135588 RepID=UPI00355A97BE|nr:glycerol kinase [Histomonas meleagridis]KAH0800930.1 glycerol kinase [Histomonas meleagridis]